MNRTAEIDPNVAGAFDPIFLVSRDRGNVEPENLDMGVAAVSLFFRTTTFRAELDNLLASSA